MSATTSTPAWVEERRATAAARFAQTGFPTTRQEEWRFTNVAPIADTKFPLAQGAPQHAASLVNSVVFLAPCGWRSSTAGLPPACRT